MSRTHILTLLIVFPILFLGCDAIKTSQTSAPSASPSPSPGEPKTKLEAFVAKGGVVVIKGYSEMGTLKGTSGGSVAFDSQEFTDTATGKKEYGMTVEVKSSNTYQPGNTSYIDYDEIDSLIKGLDYINKVDKNITQLSNFEAHYRTKGDLRIVTFNKEDGSIACAIYSGTIGAASVFFKKEDVPKIRSLVAAAKAKLDAIQKNK